MAGEADLNVDEKGGSKKKLIIIIIGVLLVLGAAAGVALIALGGNADETAAASRVENNAVVHEAIYVQLPRPFLFNLPGAKRDRLVQITVQLLVRGSDNEGIVRKHIPILESTLLNTFSAASASELATQEGKAKLRESALVQAQSALNELTGRVIVERVLFTGFVMQ